MFQQIWKYPFLLLNGVLNLAYYTGETMLYKEPLGLVFLVIASLASSFLINPTLYIIGQPTSSNIPWYVMTLGIIGALFCVIERKPTRVEDPNDTIKIPTSAQGSRFTSAYDGINNIQAPLLPKEIEIDTSLKSRMATIFLSSLRVFLPFILLSFTYALWFVIQRTVNNVYHVNAFAYNSLDQGLLPIYVFLYLALTDFFIPFRKCYEEPENYEERFLQSIKSSWHEASLVNLFVYRFFINGRAIAYFFLTVNYDLDLVYLELTLCRVLFSWFGALILTCFPQFIHTTLEEKKTTLSPFNLVLKFIGTTAIVLSLILLNFK